MKKNYAIADKAAGRIANIILRIQKKFAEVLGRKSKFWKAKEQWIFLYMVCLVFGGLSVVAVMRPFNKKSPVVVSRPATIKMPRMLPEENSARITDEEIKRVRAFKESLDSTTKNKLLIQRPGLLDSLEKVEQLYY
jgi:hypothetical protein